MYYPTFPDGTIHAVNLPPDVKKSFMAHVDVDGTVAPGVGVLQGNYLIYAGYKIKIGKYDYQPADVTTNTPVTFKIRII